MVTGTPNADGRPGSAAGLTDARHAHAVAGALVASGAFTADLRMPTDQWFRWKSGILAPCGCNCRRLKRFYADPRRHRWPLSATW